MTNIATKIPFSGFYQSLHDMQIDDEFDSASREYGEGNVEYAFSKETFLEFAKRYSDVVSVILSDILEVESVLKVLDVHSPKEYNFTTDSISGSLNIEAIEAAESFLTTYADEWSNLVELELEARSGFMPFYSNDASDWPAGMVEWDAPQIEMALQFILSKGLDDWEESVIESLSCNGAYADFIKVEDND